ncbi:unnamed protein product [Closterium sp. NIES-54]
MTTLRVLLHVSAQREYELHSLDFSTAFLQSSLHEEIWLHRPPGFTGSFPAGTQWSLRRPVYGLCQAPREWHDTLRTTLAALGFAPSTADPSLFLRIDTTLPPFYVLVYVDDLVFATADTEALALVKSELQKRHTCTDLGELTSYLGLRITRDRAQHTITLTQSHMVQQVLQRFAFTYSSPQSTPLPTGHSLSAPPSDESVEPSGPYPELVGCLMFPNCTHLLASSVIRSFTILTRACNPSLGSIGDHQWTSDTAASALRPTAASASRPSALRVAPCCSQRVAPYCSQRVAPCCLARQALLPHTRPAATTAAAAACATAAAGGGAAGSAGSAAGAGGAGGAPGIAGGAVGAGRATGIAGGAAGAGGAGPTTHRHCLSWPLSRQLQRLGVDSGGHCLSRTTPALSSFASGRQQSQQETFSPQVLSEMFPQRCVAGSVKAAALGASESAAALGVSESAAALGASESAAALGACASPATGPSSAEAFHTFTLDSGTSRCFFRDCTALTPLAAPVPVSLAGPSGGLVVARASTVLPCPAVPSGSLSGLHLPTFSTNLVSNAAIQDVWVDTFIPGGQRVACQTLFI